MVQGYYTLDEAAEILGMEAEELKQMAQKQKVRAFSDRGSWRFRTQDIQELARQRGVASSPDLQLGEAPRSDSTKISRPTGDPEVFHFQLDDDSSGVGDQISLDPAAGKKGGPKSSGKNLTRKPGSDSDVRLVPETASDLEFKLPGDSGLRVADSPVPGSKSKKRPMVSSGSGDSGVRLVPAGPGSDSDVKIVPDSGDQDIIPLASQTQKTSTGSDSDIRIEPSAGPGSGVRVGERSPEDSVLTEEIDLDAELKRAEAEAKGKKPAAPKGKPKPPAKTSPFELSDSDLEAPKLPPPGQKRKTDSSSEFDLAAKGGKPDSSDFELSLKDDSSSPIDIEDETTAYAQGDEVQLGVAPVKPAGSDPDSGINLQDVADSGISLEPGSSDDSIEFELTMDSAGSTPKPKKAPAMVDSDSEFELTLDDSGGLAPLEDDSSTGSSPVEDKDIFETDFEVPALEDESGSEAVAIDGSDTNADSSDFDLALSDDDISAEDDSGSQVVVLEDEGDVDESAQTVARPTVKGRAKKPADDEEAEVDDEGAVVGEVEEEVEAEAEEEGMPIRRPAVAAAPADWGVVPALALIPCVVVMFLTGVMGFELLRGMWGYRQGSKYSGPLVKWMAGNIVDLPKD